MTPSSRFEPNAAVSFLVFDERRQKRRPLLAVVGQLAVVTGKSVTKTWMDDPAGLVEELCPILFFLTLLPNKMNKKRMNNH